MTSISARAFLSMAAALAGVAGTACGGDDAGTLVVRNADDVQVMTPDEVADQRLPTLTVAPTLPGDVGDPSQPPPSGGSAAPDGTGGSDTIPLVADNRPPELKLFEAFDQFTSCLADDGYKIEGDLQDPNNPAYQDPEYLNAVQTCAARSDIVGALEEVQSTRSNLTPEEVEQRNEVFVELRACLEAKGWTVETTVDENGLINPTTFQDPDGQLDTRDINQCLSEADLG